MNWDRIQGDWKQFSGRARTQWGKLTDDQIEQVGGRKDELVGRIQEAYGIAREEAQRQVDAWSASLQDSGTSGTGGTGAAGLGATGTGGTGTPGSGSTGASAMGSGAMGSTGNGAGSAGAGGSGMGGSTSSGMSGGASSGTSSGMGTGTAGGADDGMHAEADDAGQTPFGQTAADQAARWAEEARRGADQLAERVREQPLKAVAIAAGIGALISLLISR